MTQIPLDIRYATTNNFTKQVLYPDSSCWLRPDTARKLTAAQAELVSRGLSLKIFDCYRPLEVQKKMWTLVPDERYVANPAKGSRHNRGAAVDLTIVRKDGSEVPMPTAYDDFSEKAHRNYGGLPTSILANRSLLEQTMVKHGFEGLPTEWWHFDDSEWRKYSILEVQPRR